MRKNFLFIVIFLSYFLANSVKSQIGIGTTNPTADFEVFDSAANDPCTPELGNGWSIPTST